MPTKSDYRGMLKDGLSMREIADRMVTFAKSMLEDEDADDSDEEGTEEEEMGEMEELIKGKGKKKKKGSNKILLALSKGG